MTSAQTLSSDTRHEFLIYSKHLHRQFTCQNYNRILNDSYPHQKLMTVLFKGVTDQFAVSGIGSYELTSPNKVQHTDTDKEELSSLAGEIRFSKVFRGIDSEVKLNSEGKVRLWANWGQIKLKDKPIELQTVVKMDHAVTFFKSQVTGTYKTPYWTFNTRLHYRRDNINNYNISQKVTYLKDKVYAGVYGNLSLNIFYFKHYNALVGYKLKDNLSVYLEHESIPAKKFEYPGMKLGKVYLTAWLTEKYLTTIGQFSHNFQEKKSLLAVTSIYQLNNRYTLRGKTDSDGILTLAAQYWVNKNVTVAGGVSIPLLGSKKQKPTKPENSKAIGVRVNLTF
eukprot:CAMPEP_0176421282 /NCGR_PEP_ID=MMETSP0127-20121128/9079_1 /TAXON_ID=938130 /ORGANISM="Platyophrya macrostoma, Strain WH" /LENGTH=336 /DNA_ID=CAMNT_0017801979 /DNA_START=41 /DNA_END=1051 /DNA_ORIENTATION=-